jgi:hypothetical protein
MHRTARILGFVALVCAVGCGTHTSEAPDGGAAVGTDAGPAVYTATFYGEAAGSLAVHVGFQYATSIGEPYPNASYAVYFYFLSSIGANFDAPIFGCTGTLPGTALDAGSFTASDVGDLSCSLGATVDGGSYPEFWQTVSMFELNVNAPGAAGTTTNDPRELVWPDAIGSLTVTLAPLEPGVLGYPSGTVNLNVRFGAPSD